MNVLDAAVLVVDVATFVNLLFHMVSGCADIPCNGSHI